MALKTIVACGALAGLVACSSDDVKPVARVDVSLGGFDPMFAAYVRVDEAEWAAVNDYDFTGGIVSFGVEFDRYVTVAVRCTGDFADTYVIERSIARGDLAELGFPCRRGPSPTKHRVAGQLASIGTVALGEASAGGVDLFELEVPSGTYDLVASNDSSLYYQPDLIVTGDMELPPIDVDAEGTTLSTTPVDVPADFADWRASTRTALATPNGTVVALRSNDSAVVTPSGELLAQGVALDAYIELRHTNQAQFIRAPVSGLSNAPVASFPEPLPLEILPTSLDALDASFSGVPQAVDYVLALTEGLGNRSPSMGLVVATDGWREASAAASLSFDPPPEIALPLTVTYVSFRARFARQPDDVVGSVLLQGRENSNSSVGTTLRR